MLVSIEGVGVSFGQFEVLKNINCTIEEGQKIGIIGKNGAGKSTLLKVICDEIQMYEGEVQKQRGLEIGYLKQDSGLNLNNTVFEEIKSVFDPLQETKKQMDKLSEDMSLYQNDPQEYEIAAKEYAKLQSYYEYKDGYEYNYKIDIVLNGMGFSKETYEKSIGKLSGGEKTRLALAKMVLSKPQLLILDEPTNHLDFKTLVWLEDYLKDYPSAVLIVSHDRYFLDQLVDTIFEVERGRLTTFKGNYSKYLELKEAKVKKQQQEYDAQQEERKRLQDYVDRNLVRASTSKMAKSRRKVLEKMELVEKPPSQGKSAKISFNCVSNPYKEVIKAEHVQVAIDTSEGLKVLIDEINLLVERGQKVAIVGENGTGKSTFLKMVLGKLPVKKGYLQLGRHTLVGYYDQEQTELDQGLTVLEQVWSRYPTMTEFEVRSHLAKVLFTGEEIEKQTSAISGGEKAKLAFALLMLTPSNVLILDEPTNHLDVYAREVIEDALKEYEGTVLFVSHDRYLLNKVADSIVEFTPQGATLYKNGFGQYQSVLNEEKQVGEQKKQEPKQKAKPAPQKQVTGYRSKEQRKREVQRKEQISALEKEIENLEQQALQTETLLLQEEIYTDFAKLHENSEILGNLRQTIEQKSEELLRLWEESETAQ